MSELKTRLDNMTADMNAKIAALNEEIRAMATEVLTDAASQLFEDHPIVEKIFWTQYTPYFNDGDACEFSRHDIFYTLVGDEDACDYEGSQVPTPSTIEMYRTYAESRRHNQEYWQRRLEEALREQEKWADKGFLEFAADFDSLVNAINAISDDVMKATYGDHVQVTIERGPDGKARVVVDEYEHD